MPRASWMDGSARFTIDTSRKTMNWARQTKARIAPGVPPVHLPDVREGPDRLMVESWEAIRSYRGEQRQAPWRLRPGPADGPAGGLGAGWSAGGGLAVAGHGRQRPGAVLAPRPGRHGSGSPGG